MQSFARILKLLGHPDRLRILALLSEEELTVSELVSVLELSQPRITQFIQSLEEADIVDRLREGSWVFSRLRPASESLTADLVSGLLARLPKDDPCLQADLNRLAQVRALRANRAEQFFSDVANDRGRLSYEFLPQARVEDAILNIVGARKFECMVDLGTGSGRMLALLSEHVERGIGVDLSPDMLRVARYTLSAPEYQHLSVQQSDLMQTTLRDGLADLVTLHQVLHHLDRPAEALTEAARLLQPGGSLLIVDFAEHEREEFRDQFAHRRLGFLEDEVTELLSGLTFGTIQCTRVKADDDHPDLLIWQAERYAEQRQKALS